MEASGEVNLQAQEEVSKEGFEVIGVVTCGVGTPGIDEGSVCSGFVVFGYIASCHFILCCMFECTAVSLCDGLMEVGGDDACVDVIGQCGGVRVML